MNLKKFLTSIGVIASVLVLTLGILVFVHTVVASRLERTERSVPEEAMLNMTEGVTLTALDDIAPADGIVRKYSVQDEKGEVVNYVFEAVSTGLDGDVRIYISFDEDLLIDEIQVLETAAQPTNLGYKAASAEYLSQYKGAASVTTDAKSITGTLIQIPEGADYSCQGVYSCVRAAFQQLELIKTALTEMEGTDNEN